MILLFKDVLLIVSFPFSFLSIIYPPPLLCKPFSPPFFFYIPSSIMIIKSLYCMVKRWGPSAASQLVEQNKERNVSFFLHIYILFFLSFFRVNSFPTNNNFSSPVRQYTKERCASPHTLSLFFFFFFLVLLNKLTIFFSKNANNGSQHLRDTLPFFSSLFFIFISFFRYTLSVSFLDVLVNMT
jgi:hypothetical protein